MKVQDGAQEVSPPTPLRKFKSCDSAIIEAEKSSSEIAFRLVLGSGCLVSQPAYELCCLSGRGVARL